MPARIDRFGRFRTVSDRGFVSVDVLVVAHRTNQPSTNVPTLRELAANHQHQLLESCESTISHILNRGRVGPAGTGPDCRDFKFRGPCALHALHLTYI